MLPHFYYHPRMLDYAITPNHPLKPERLRRTIEFLAHYGVEPIDPGPGSRADVLRVHSIPYLQAVEDLDPETGKEALPDFENVREIEDDPRIKYGFASMDNPPFPGMYRSSLAYVAGSVKAAEAVRDGAPLAFGMAGGLHHARRAGASGFCVFNDCAIACHILREKFDRVAYVDIDVHHGEGVQWIWEDDPSVLTCSIHESGRTLYPGVGFVEETGKDFSALNVPMEAKTTGDVWLDSFQRTILPALETFRPGAIVLQMGTDTHYLDPLGHLQNTAQEWLTAVRNIRDLGIPIVALGGGGYNLTTVPRMWTAACLTLAGIDFDERIPAEFVERLGVARFFDEVMPGPRGRGSEAAKQVVSWLEKNHLPNIAHR